MFPDARVHMIYFPWDRNQRLAEPTDAFDRIPYDTMVHYAHPMTVELWTYERAQTFCRLEYPEIHEALNNVARPVMLVDVLRWKDPEGASMSGLFLALSFGSLVIMNTLLQIGLQGSTHATRKAISYQVKPK